MKKWKKYEEMTEVGFLFGYKLGSLD
jgi:hypothetical protein